MREEADEFVPLVPTAAEQILLDARQRIALADGTVAKLEATRDGARTLAIPVRHGGIDKQTVIDGLLEQAKNSGVVDDTTLATVEQTIARGLSEFPGGENVVRFADSRDDDEPPPYGEPPTPRVIVPTPYRYRDPSQIDPRQWLYGRHYIRRYVSATIGAPGMGKTSLELVEAIDQVTGLGLLGGPVRAPLRVWYWNGEDPRDEIERRVAAILLHFNLTADDLGGRLSFDSGRDLKFCIAATGPRGPVVNTSDTDALTAAIRDFGADVAIFDPYISTHRAVENNNSDTDLIIKDGFAAIAEAANCAIELAHHVRKKQYGQESHTVDDARGGGALIGAVRSARVLNRMTDKEANAVGVTDERRPFFFRVDLGKANMQPPATAATWRELVPEPLGNSREHWPEDIVQVCTAWQAPTVTSAAELQIDETFLRLLDLFTAQGRAVRPTDSREGAPQKFADHPDNGGVTKRAFNVAMERLLQRGAILSIPDGKPTKNLKRLVRASAPERMVEAAE